MSERFPPANAQKNTQRRRTQIRKRPDANAHSQASGFWYELYQVVGMATVIYFTDSCPACHRPEESAESVREHLQMAIARCRRRERSPTMNKSWRGPVLDRRSSDLWFPPRPRTCR